jgi:hypothetical protein
MKKVRRERADPSGDVERATVDQVLGLRDACDLFDGGRDHQFHFMAVALRALCHSGSSGSLLNGVREAGRAFPSSVHRPLAELDNGASDLFQVAQVGGGSRVLPRLELGVTDMKTRKFKNWWREVVVTNERRRGISRGEIVLELANSEGGAHFTNDLEEVYEELARHNGLGLWTMENGAWRDYGHAPVRATVRQIAH